MEYKKDIFDKSADVNSVFEIAWYTLARMMSEDVSPEEKGTEEERPEGVMICCRNCGQFFIRRNNRQEFCDLPECQKARNRSIKNGSVTAKRLKRLMRKSNFL